MPAKSKRVLLIGAGPCGLLTLRHCLDQGVDVTCVDKRSVVGGLWGVPSGEPGAMYDGMRTVLPKEIMAAGGLSYSPDLPSFIGRDDVRDYFVRYAREFGLMPSIQLGTEVRSVVPDGDDLIVTLAPVGRDVTVERYNSVVVCTGVATTPNPPPLVDEQTYRGTVLHSADYVNGETQFRKTDTVVMMGAKASGWSIAHLVAPSVKQVIVVKRDNAEFWPQTDIPDNVSFQTHDFAGYYPDGLLTTAGDKVPCDVVMYCTGYKISFPFLDLTEFPGLRIDGPAYVGPLYNELIAISNPNLMFVGFSRHCFGMFAFDIQGRYIAHVLAGKIPDLAKKIREADQKPYRDRRGRAALSNPAAANLPDFSNNLLREIGEPPLRPVLMAIYRDCLKRRETSLPQTRAINYHIIDDETFTTTSPACEEASLLQRG